MAHRTIEQRVSAIDAEIEEIKKSSKIKIQKLEEMKNNILKKKNEKILKLIQDSGLNTLSEYEIKELILQIKK